MNDLKISKELLIEVLGSEYNQRLVDWFQIEDDNFLRTYYDCGSYDDKGRPTGLGLEINIYEFAFKCKDWALTKGYMMKIENHYSNSIVVQIKKTISNSAYVEPWKKTFKSELEAIIKACEWILENSK